MRRDVEIIDIYFINLTQLIIGKQVLLTEVEARRKRIRALPPPPTKKKKKVINSPLHTRQYDGTNASEAPGTSVSSPVRDSNVDRWTVRGPDCELPCRGV